mgnify:CR=1 FL=1
MGLISAALGAAGGVLADTWKEFFYCEALDKETLMVKGQKVIGSRSSNTKGNDNIISNGSGIVVADGQCMIIVDQGVVVEVCAEPGEFTYDASSEPSLFSGSLGQSIINTFKQIGKRIGYGGDTGKDQRVYYFNTKELLDNKFGTPNPVPFRVVDANIGLDLDTAVRCSGVYSYKIVDPILFYTNVCGNVTDTYKRSEIQDQLKTEFVSALQPAFGKLSDLQIRPNQIVTHTAELEDAMNQALSAKWGEIRGLQVVSIAIGTLTLPEEDQALIKEKQSKRADAGIYSDANLAAGMMAGATAEAMKNAASNEGGAMNGFVGMGMAMNMGGNNLGNLYAMGQQQGGAQGQPPQGQPPQGGAPAAGGWDCSCGATGNTGKFCAQCGAKKPEPPKAEGWDCPQCGAKGNTGKFCAECGTKKPADGPAACPKCGKEVAPGAKFCPECGEKLQ